MTQHTADHHRVTTAATEMILLSEASLPINGSETVAEVAGPMMEMIPAADFPYLAEFSAEHVMRPDYDFGSEFEFGLDLVLDGLDARVAPSR